MNKKLESNEAMMEYVGAFIGLLVVIIIAVSVVIPTVLTAISQNPEITGTTATVLGIVPLMIAVVVLLLVVAMIQS